MSHIYPLLPRSSTLKMPEFKTIDDMVRRLHKVIQQSGGIKAKLELHPEHLQVYAKSPKVSGYEAGWSASEAEAMMQWYPTWDEIKKMGKAKKDALKREQPGLFEPNIRKAFAGWAGTSLDPEEIKNTIPADFVNSRIFHITESSIEAHGKTFIIDLGSQPGGEHGEEHWYINCEFFLHGHVVPITNEELRFTRNSWQTSIPRHTFQLALVNQDPDPQAFSIMVIDYMKLATCSFVRTNAPLNGHFTAATLNNFCPAPANQHLPQMRTKVKGRMLSVPKPRGPCPLKETQLWFVKFAEWHTTAKTGIYRQITAKSEFWEGFGTSHTNEVLYWAAIHPHERACDVDRDPVLRARLCEGVRLFLDLLKSAEYAKRTPAGRNTPLAFHESEGVSRNQNENIFKCHRHTRTASKTPLGLYQKLRDLDYLDPAVTARIDARGHEAKSSRALPIYAVSISGTDGTCYTPIAAHAAPKNENMAKNRYYSDEESKKKGLDYTKGNAEIGPSSFQGHKGPTVAKKAPRKRGRPSKADGRTKTGNRGRPQKLAGTVHDAMSRGYNVKGALNEYSEEEMARILEGWDTIQDGPVREMIEAVLEDGGMVNDVQDLMSGVPPDQISEQVSVTSSEQTPDHAQDGDVEMDWDTASQDDMELSEE